MKVNLKNMYGKNTYISKNKIFYFQCLSCYIKVNKLTEYKFVGVKSYFCKHCGHKVNSVVRIEINEE